MYSIKSRLSEILDFIEDKNDVIFVDFPLYHNIGDLLIMSGTMKFFKNNSIRVKLHLSAHNLNIDKAITKNTTIIC